MSRRKTVFSPGTITIGETVDVTDPCYDKSVWCRRNGIKTVPGEYVCEYHTKNCGEYMWQGEKHIDERVSLSMIYLKDRHKKAPRIRDFSPIGGIGVDAGLAGYFPDKPDYDDEQWAKFCDNIKEGDAWITEDGYFTSSGYGDGGYTVSAIKDDNGRATALMIEFL